MEFVRLCINDTLVMKKAHPCGGNKFQVLRLGSDIKIKCLTCGRELTIDRTKLEKRIRNIEKLGGTEN